MKKSTIIPLLVVLPFLTTGCQNNEYVSKLFKSRDKKEQTVAQKQDGDNGSVYGEAAKKESTPSQARSASTQAAVAATASNMSTPEQLYQKGYNTFYGIGMHYDEKKGIALLEQAAMKNHEKARTELKRLAYLGYQVNPSVLDTHAKTASNTSSHQTIQPQKLEDTAVVSTQDWYYSEPVDTTVNTDLPRPRNTATTKQTTAQSQASTRDTLSRKQFTSDETAFLAMDKSLYTLQLVAAKDKDGVDRFVIDNGLQRDARIVKKHVGGRDWYVALYGNYADRDQAQAAANQIENNLNQRITPWVRPVDVIQEEINSQS